MSDTESGAGTDVTADPSGAPGAEAAPPKTTFADLGLGPEVLSALGEMGFTEPMHVQAATVPLVLAGTDLMVQSRTGSGKTAAFGIPLVDRVARAEDKFVQAIVLLPTRELALQVASEIARIAAHSAVTVVPVYGGAPMGRQIEQLKAGGQIVCGTPGRVLDHLRRGTLKLDGVRCVVLDECDEMLSMGFQEDIEAIVDRTPAERQTLLFSATVPEGIQRLSRRFLRNPEFLKLSADFVGVQEIRHVYYAIPGGQREAELLRVLAFENPNRAIVFCNTREETGRVAEFLRRQGFEAEAISSDLSQADREKVMARMRAGGIRFLVATDVAARGIDLDSLSHVINYTFPESPEVYIHRTGRTGRAGKHGTAISLIGPTEVGAFYYVKLLYKIRPEERSLPSEAEIRSKREGERILALRARFPEEVGAGWRSLARRVVSAVDGEQLIAALLADALGAGATAKPAATTRANETSAIVAAPMATREERPRSERTDRPERPARVDRPDRGPERGSNGERPADRFERSSSSAPPNGRERPREERDRARRPRGEYGGRDRGPERSDRGPRPERTVRPDRPDHVAGTPPPPSSSPPPVAVRSETPRREQSEAPPPAALPRTEKRSSSGSAAPAAEPEFWSVWSETGSAPAAPATPSETVVIETADVGRGSAPTIVDASERRMPSEPAEGQARLFLNLGRKDEADRDEVTGLLGELGVSVPPEDVEVMNTHAYINVPAGEAERLCAAISGRERRGRQLLCEPARPRRR